MTPDDATRPKKFGALCCFTVEKFWDPLLHYTTAIIQSPMQGDWLGFRLGACMACASEGLSRSPCGFHAVLMVVKAADAIQMVQKRTEIDCQSGMPKTRGNHTLRKTSRKTSPKTSRKAFPASLTATFPKNLPKNVPKNDLVEILNTI